MSGLRHTLGECIGDWGSRGNVLIINTYVITAVHDGMRYTCCAGAPTLEGVLSNDACVHDRSRWFGGRCCRTSFSRSFHLSRVRKTHGWPRFSKDWLGLGRAGLDASRL